MTEAIYIETNIAVKELQISVSGVLLYLGVSRSGYHRWLNREPSQQELRKEGVIQRVIEIHAESYQNYGAPKIAVILNKENVTILHSHIETFYNTVRIHSHCDYLSPNQYEIAYEQSKIQN